MLKNFDLYRLKKAGMTNLSINKLVKFQTKHSQKLTLRQMGQISGVKSLANFIEAYKNQDAKALYQEFKKFPSFSILDEVYPERLKEIYNPPTLLFYQGNLELVSKIKIAFVGSREASENGKKAVQKLIHELNNQFVIVSGLARGIDTVSHMAAIRSGGFSIAVIGTGIDVNYPPENHKLQYYMGKNQLLLTEYGPGEKPIKFHFPERNRIIAGLSRGVVVIEAKMRSGSLITCERALEEGRDIFAVPGPIADGFSDGCNYLIQQGAKLVYKGYDIIEEYQSF